MPQIPHAGSAIDVNGWCGGDSIAMVVSLVRGENDNQLCWSFDGMITVQALNQLIDCVQTFGVLWWRLQVSTSSR